MENDLLREISHLYYEENYTQQDIAKKLFLSRAGVSRALEEARRRGIVEIIIHYPYENHDELGQRLTERFGLKYASVNLDGNSLAAESYAAVCKLAARELRRQINNDTVMGISRGRTTKYVVQYFTPSRTLPDMQLVQLCGAHEENNPALFEESDLIRTLQNKLNCSSFCMFVPGILESKELRNMLANRKNVRLVMNMAAQVNFLCLSVTTLEQWKRWLPDKIAGLRRQNVVGNILGYFFDVDGRIVENSVYDRMILPDRSIFQAEQRMLVVADSFKAHAAYAALKGGLANSIVTQSKIARRILALSEGKTGQGAE